MPDPYICRYKNPQFQIDCKLLALVGGWCKTCIHDVQDDVQDDVHKDAGCRTRELLTDRREIGLKPGEKAIV